MVISSIRATYLILFFGVASLVLWQSSDCPNASDVTRKNMAWIAHYLAKTKDEEGVRANGARLQNMGKIGSCVTTTKRDKA